MDGAVRTIKFALKIHKDETGTGRDKQTGGQDFYF